MGLLGQRTNTSLVLFIISRSPSIRVMPLGTPSRNVWECLFSPSFATECHVKLLNSTSLMNEKQFFGAV